MKKHKTIVCFHTGRGGRFNKPGHVKYIGEMNLRDVIYQLKADNTFVQNRDEKGRFCRQYISDAAGETVINQDDWATGTGTADFDGAYDTYRCFDIEECNEKELKMIYQTGETWTEAWIYAEKKLVC